MGGIWLKINACSFPKSFYRSFSWQNLSPTLTNMQQQVNEHWVLNSQLFKLAKQTAKLGAS